MSQEIKIPPVGESITSALVANWHHADGDTVKKGDILVTLETDKVSTELEAENGGILSIKVQEGEEVDIGTVIGSLEEAAEGNGEDKKDDAPDKKDSDADEKSEKSNSGKEDTQDEEKSSSDSSSQSGGGEEKTVPVKVPSAGDSITSATVAQWHAENGARVSKGDRLVTLDTDKVSSELEAEENGVLKIEVTEGTEVDIGAILGSLTIGGATPEKSDESDKSDQSKKSDESDESEKTNPDTPVEKSKPSPGPGKLDDTPKSAKSAPAPAPEKSAPKDKSERVTRRKMTPLRRKIADHLVNAQQTAAILTTFNEVDMSGIMALRKQVQEDFVAKHGVKLGFMSLFVKATVQALKDVPQVNGRIEGHEVIENNYYDIGVAVGTPKGLVVPVLRDCEEKSFAQIEQDIGAYAERARDGKLTLDDLQGGVFTISNGGVYGSLLSTPILNPPQSAILGMHTIQQRPVAIDGKVEIRPMMYLAMSYDHRLIDGKEAVTFLIRIKECLETPTRMMLEL